MTKKELEAAVTALMAAQQHPAATAAPAVAAPATVPWIGAAVQAAVPKAPKPVKAPHTPLPLQAEILTVNPDPTKGHTWAAFKSVHIHNGRSGRAYRGNKLDARVIAFVLQHGPELLKQLQ